MVTDHLVELKRWVNEFPETTGDGDEPRFRRAVELISKTFGVSDHEVAILGITSDGLFLRFLTPNTLRVVGQIPLSSGSALAVRTLRDMKPEIVNHFYVVPHASVFEGVPVSETERGDPIQKIMSAPVMSANKAVGVVQVCRKGKTTTDAGPDFTPVQLRTLKTMSDALAPCLLICARD